MKRIPACFLTVALIASGTQALEAPVTLGVFTGEEGVFGQGDLVLPIHRYDQGLLFFNPRVSASDSDQQETNIGLGLRQQLDWPGSYILGANVFYDGRWSANNNRFDQIGLGLELLSDRIDARANYYLPNKDMYLIDTVRMESVEQSEFVRRHVDNWFEPYATGNQVNQDYGWRLTTQRTVFTETSWQIYDRYESALEGFDTEIGWRLPMLEDWGETRIFAGYQYFDNPFGPEFKGGKARMEVRMFDGLLTLDAHVYEDDDLNMTDYLVGMRVRLPLEPSGLALWRNLRHHRVRQGGLAERLTEMVMRDPKVQSRESGYIADPDLRGIVVETKTKVTRNTRTDGTVVVMEDVVFVSPDGNDGATGTAEDPKRSIQNGVNAAYGQQHVYVFGGNYNESVVVNPGVLLMGSGCMIPANGGHFFGGGVPSVIVAPGSAPAAVTMQDNSFVGGFDISNPGGRGIYSSAGALVIRCNYIHNTLVGVEVERSGDVDLLLANNTLANNTQDGARISGTGASGTYLVNASGNTFANNGENGISLSAGNYDTAVATLDDNTATGNETGLRVSLDADELAMLSIGNTRANNNRGTGIQASVSADQMAAALVGTPLIGVDSLGLEEAKVEGSDHPSLVISSAPVQASGNGGNGIDLDVQSDLVGAALLLDVEASNNGGHGAHVAVDGSLAIGLAGASGNVMEVAQLAVDLIELLDTDMALPELPTLSAGPSVFSGNVGDGLLLDVNSDVLSIGVVLGAEADNNGNNGLAMNVATEDGMAAIGLMARFDAAGNAGHGAAMQVDGDFLAAGVLLDGRVSGNGDDGVDLDVCSSGISLGLIASTDPLRAVADMVNTEFDLDPPVEIQGEPWGAFEATGNAGDGIHADIVGDIAAIGIFLDIQANNNGGDGADLTLDGGLASIGLVASTENIMEVAQLGLNAIGLLDEDLNLPALPALTSGPVEFNSNGGEGLVLEVDSGLLAVGAVLGAEANNNGNNGLEMTVDAAEGLAAIGLMARFSATNNADDGVDMLVEGGSIAAGVLLDGQANNNGDDGVDMGVYSDGIALGLIASTDPLRSVAGLLSDALDLDRSFEIPGEPWGAFEASGNAGDGIYADIHGDETAIGIYLDIHANNNGLSGLFSHIYSENGSAIGVAGSSDTLFDVLPVLLSGDPDAAPLDYTPMGPMIASGNGSGGIALFVEGQNAIGLIGGTVTDDNQVGEFSGAGTLLSVSAEYDVAVGIVYDAVARNNAEDGVSVIVEQHGEGDAVAALVNVQANENGQDGILAQVQSEDAAFVLMAGIDAHDNEGHGIGAEAIAAGDVGMAFTAVDSSGNGMAGLMALAVSGVDSNMVVGVGARAGGLLAEVNTNQANIYVGETALDDLRDEFGNSLPFGDSLYALMPTGTCTFSENEVGAMLGAVAMGHGDATVVVSGSEFSANEMLGLYTMAMAEEGDAAIVAMDNEFVDNGGDGMSARARTQIGDAAVIAVENEFANNQDAGLNAYARVSLGESIVLADGNSATGNEVGITALAGNQFGVAAVVLEENQVTGNNSDGVRVRAESDDGDAVVVAGENEFSDNGANGMMALARTRRGDAAVIAVDNSMSNNGENGMMVLARTRRGDATVQAEVNDFSGNGNDGMVAMARARRGDAVVRVFENTASNNGDDGLMVHAQAVTGDATARVRGNTTNDNGDDGVFASALTETGDATTRVRLNTANNNGGDGLVSETQTDVGDVTAIMNNNTATNNAGNALSLTATVITSGTITYEMNNNTF